MRPQEELAFVDGFEVRIKRKKVKAMRIRVAPPDGHVEASVPFCVPTKKVLEFVQSKHSWVLKQQDKLRSSPQLQAELADDAEVHRWKREVSSLAPPLVGKWASALGVTPGMLAYRNMRSRWGSCQVSTGRICINTRLALYPPECLEYVVVHELCHLREPGHNPRFWALVEACLPNYRAANKLLRQ